MARDEDEHPEVPEERPKRRRGRPVVPFRIEGEIVPYDPLCRNPNNPYEYMSDAQRQEALVEMLAEIIQRKMDEERAEQNRQEKPP
jgi:hypothetical protein